MWQAILAFVVGATVGLFYGRMASFHHLWIPPNWVGWLFGLDGESGYDAAFISLILSAGIFAVLIWAGIRHFWFGGYRL